MVFGWKIERPHPSFEAPGLIGLWVEDRPPAAMAGPLIWISVDHIDASLELVAADGGEGPRTVDRPRRMVHHPRPAGNTQRSPRQAAATPNPVLH